MPGESTANRTSETCESRSDDKDFELTCFVASLLLFDVNTRSHCESLQDKHLDVRERIDRYFVDKSINLGVFILCSSETRFEISKDGGLTPTFLMPTSDIFKFVISGT